MGKGENTIKRDVWVFGCRENWRNKSKEGISGALIP